MGLFGHPFSNTLKKIRSWFTGVETQGYCYKCRIYNHSCRSCGQLFCRNCSHCGSERSILCKICSHAVDCHESSPDSPLLRFNKSGLSNFSNVSSPRSTRVDEEDSGEDMEKDFFSAPSELSQDSSDIDSVSTTCGHNMQGFLSADSSPLRSPTTDFNHTLSGESTSNAESPRYCRKTRDDCKKSLENSPEAKHESLYGNNANQKVQKQLDFGKNELIWDPPSPGDEDHDVENGFFGYDDDNEDDNKSNSYFSCSSFSSRSLSIREKHDDADKEQFRNSVHVHFKALVSQLLIGEGIQISDKDGSEGWLDIVTSLAWQAATFVKPDNSKGGNMDPGNSVKVKCILSGNPTDSKFVKGVVCAKNIKHKRMISQYKNPRLFLLSGALEYEKPTNKLASINTVLKQETDQLNIALSKIEAYRPNVLLVGKSVSSFAQDYLLKKEISLVLNVKQTLLERIARCTGANIATNIDNITRTRLGHCEMFRVEKFEEYSSKNNPNKKSIKSLMFFEGCPWHFGCTALLHGSNIEELKKVKRVVQYASFAAYHLSRETSYLVDEGGALPKLHQNELKMLKSSVISDTIQTVNCHNFQPDIKNHDKGLNHRIEERENVHEGGMLEQSEENGNMNYFSAANSQSILVSVSTNCVSKGTICESSKLIRINFYGSFDKPLGRYLCDDLFDQKSCCRICKQRSEAHVRCYTNQHGCLKISVHRYSSLKLPGERDGKIWMWHRCLECECINGVPPAAQRVVMSDAAWSLSFGKFLELSFSNHAPANRVATCGHSLQKDCLHFYGSGSMVACFQYSPVDILSVRLPPSVLNFSCKRQQELVKGEATDIVGKIEILQSDVNGVIQKFEQRILASDNEPVKTGIYNYITELQDLLKRERKEYEVFLAQETVDILKLNRLKRILLIDAHMWSQGLGLLDSFSTSKTSTLKLHSQISKDSIDYACNFKIFPEENITYPSSLEHCFSNCIDTVSSHKECETSIGRRPSVGSVLSDNIDSIWNGNPDSDTLVSIRLLNNPLCINERLNNASLQLSLVRSFDALENLNSMNASQLSSKFTSSICNIVNDGVRFMLPQKGNNELVIALYDNEPSTLISYAISSVDHFEFVNRGRQPCKDTHFRISFEDDPSMPKDKMKFSVTAYFAKQFSTLRKKCFPNESDFLRSMSRCKSWNAQGGKSHVYFAKSFDERFILKQVTKTELDSFELFASDYFKYVTESLDSGSPTCLAKCFGVYQVCVKKGGREVKTDLMVSENIFYGRNISKVYDLKGSLRARYNPVTSGIDTVLLDENLLEILKSKPIYLGSKAKRNLDRAVWNDTYFLASIDVMDYSLLVGIDDETKELVVGIIDYMRQYTWDKHLETWVKLSGILGGPKNEAPTIISPLQYKKRFRKAMSRYFLTLPDP